MVLEDHVAQEHHAILILEKPPGIEKDWNGLGPCEHGEPADFRRGQEVRRPSFPELIATASHFSRLGSRRRCGASKTAFPRRAWERVRRRGACHQTPSS